MPKPTRRAELDTEPSTHIMYEISMQVKHNRLDEEERAAVREAFERCANNLHAALVMLGLPPEVDGVRPADTTYLRATRISSEFRALDMFGTHADYPKT